jgi:hypothetical protein
MPIIIKNCNFENNGTGIKAAVNAADIQISETNSVDNSKFLDIYVSAADLQKLGLPPNTPQDLLQEIIIILQKMPSNTQTEKENSVKQSRLFDWLGAASSASTIATAVVEFVASLG